MVDEEEGKKEQAEEGREEKKSFPIRIIIIVALVLALGGGVFFVIKSGLLIGIFKGDESLVENVNEIGPIYSMDTFIVNLLGTRSKSYLKANIELELSNEKVIEEINKRLPQFRDTILTLLSSKSDGDIRTLEGKFQIRTEIMMQLNQYLTSGNIRNVYFTDFIVQ